MALDTAKKEVLERAKTDGVKFINLQFTDIMGAVKSVAFPVERLENSLEKGTWFDGSSIEGFARVAATLRKIRRLPQLGRFLLAFLFYHTGIGTMMVVAAIFAKDDLHLGTGTIVGCLLMVQFVAMPAAFGFLALSRAIGPRNCIVLGS